MLTLPTSRWNASTPIITNLALSLVLICRSKLNSCRVQDEMSGADIKAACTEAGLLALRERRMRVTHADFKKAKEKVLYKKKEGVPEGMYM